MNPTTSGVDHVGLTVRDLDQTRRFFCDCLGWQVHDPEDCLTFDQRRNIGLHHLALKVADLATLDEVFRRVEAWPGLRLNLPLNRWARDRKFTVSCGHRCKMA
jgi:extradiol dioxygenase family protein